MKKADNFNAAKWLVENKITSQSKLNKEESQDVLKEQEKSYAEQVRDYIKSLGYNVYLKGKDFEVTDNENKTILSKKTNSFFRNAHLDSFINQLHKKIGTPNKWKLK